MPLHPPLSFPHQPPRKTADALRAFQKEQTPKRRFDPEREFSADDRTALLAELENERANRHWLRFATLAANLILLFPNHKDELRLDDDTWEVLRAVLTYRRNLVRGEPRQWYVVADFARYLHILSADHAAIDNNGHIQLSYDPIPFKKTPPLPPRK